MSVSVYIILQQNLRPNEKKQTNTLTIRTWVFSEKPYVVFPLVYRLTNKNAYIANSKQTLRTTTNPGKQRP